MAVSDFELSDLGNGRFALCGDMSFDTVERILRASEKLFDDQSDIEVDLSGVAKTDSAGLALLLEWIASAKHSKREIRFAEVPVKVLEIAQTTEVDDFLKRFYSSSSNI